MAEVQFSKDKNVTSLGSLEEEDQNSGILGAEELRFFAGGLSVVSKPIQSTNYIDRTSGWQLNSDGTTSLNKFRKKQVCRTMKNTSGGALAAGDVVVYDAASTTGDEFTTTTSQGNDLILGMVTEAVADDGYVDVLMEGYTTVLKADGTTDIAVGDLLGTFTSAGISMKAASGDMAFAIALEAYATNDSNGIIDALLITPRKV